MSWSKALPAETRYDMGMCRVCQHESILLLKLSNFESGAAIISPQAGQAPEKPGFFLVARDAAGLFLNGAPRFAALPAAAGKARAEQRP